MWRSYDRPRPGSIYRLADDLTLQRGITYTFMPDGRSLRVPAMNRLQVRAEAQGHQEGEDNDIMQALQDILAGKKPTQGRGRFDAQGRPAGAPGGRRPAHRDGLRPIQVRRRPGRGPVGPALGAALD